MGQDDVPASLSRSEFFKFWTIQLDVGGGQWFFQQVAKMMGGFVAIVITAVETCPLDLDDTELIESIYEFCQYLIER